MPALFALALLLVVAPVAVVAGGVRLGDPARVMAEAPAPGQSCPDETPAATGDVCQDVVAPTANSGFDLGILLPILGVVLAGGAIALVAAVLVLRRRADLPAQPVDPGQWWACRNCGSNNVVGSARCYSCGTWQS
jgi:hypothetical protein